MFPTRSPVYYKQYGNANNLYGIDNKLVWRYKSERRVKTTKSVFQCFDETFMRKLENMGWNRDHGVVEMVPIVVACT